MSMIFTNFLKNWRAWTLGATLAALGGVGCGDMITFSKDDRRRGESQYAAGDYDAAAASFRSAVRQDPRDYKSQYQLGAIYEAQGAHQEAVQAYLASIRVMDQTLEGKADRTFRLRTIDSMAKAIAKTSAPGALPQTGRPADDALLAAKAARYGGDPDAAVEAYAQALDLAPKDFDIAKEYGLYLESLGQARRADLALRQAYALNSEDTQVADALRRLGVVPGPSLKNMNDLASPPIPRGPLPELDLSKIGLGGGSSPQQATPSNPPPPSVNSTRSPAGGTAEAPRD